MDELTYEPVTDADQPQAREAGAGYDAGHNTQAAASIPGGGGRGRIIPITTAERGRELARRRWDAVSAAARAGIVDAGKQVPGLAHKAPAVVRYAVSQHMLNSFDPSAHGSQQSLKLVLDLAYPKPERDHAPSAAVPAGGATLALSPELAQQLLSAMRERRQQGE